LFITTLLTVKVGLHCRYWLFVIIFLPSMLSSCSETERKATWHRCNTLDLCLELICLNLGWDVGCHDWESVLFVDSPCKCQASAHLMLQVLRYRLLCEIGVDCHFRKCHWLRDWCHSSLWWWRQFPKQKYDSLDTADWPRKRYCVVSAFFITTDDCPLNLGIWKTWAIISCAYSVWQCIVLYCVRVSFPVSYKLKFFSLMFASFYWSSLIHICYKCYPVTWHLFCRIPDTLLLSEDIGLDGDEDNLCNFRC
jgi:hypothetical protein